MSEYEYRDGESRIFKKVKRPLISFEVKTKDGWLSLTDVLVDTGADISVLPKDIGERIIGDITKGKKFEIRGVVPDAKLVVFLHNLIFKIENKEFQLPIPIADSNDVPQILGRVKGLDLFNVEFLKGKKIKNSE